jgi:hypothetical protein
MAFESWRISVLENNKSPSVSLVTTSIGAVVINALKGNAKPVKIEAKSRQRIYNLFGYYSRYNPQVWDLIQYNDFRPIWVSAPNNGGTYSGVLVTKTGTQSFEGFKFSNQITSETGTLGVGTGVLTTFEIVVPNMDYYEDETIDILVNGASIVTDVSGAGATETITSGAGSGTLNTTTGALSFTFTSAPATTDTITIAYDVDKTTIDFTQIEVEETLGLGNGTTTAFNSTISWVDNYTAESVNILVNGGAIVTGVSTGGSTETLASDIGSGTLDTGTGALSFTFDTAPDSGDVIEVIYNTDFSDDVYFALYNRSPQADDTGVQISYVSSDDYFNIDFYQKDINGTYALMPDSPLQVSLTEGAKNGYGDNIYIDRILGDYDYLNYTLNTAITVSTFTDDTSIVDFNGGDRGDDITSTGYTTGWSYFQDCSNYPADIFMDFSANASIPSIFSTLRNTYQKYKSYLVPLPRTDVPADAITTKEGYSISDRGIYYYYNWGKVTDDLNDDNFYASLIGRVGVRIAVTDNKFNGDTVSWLNSDGEHGGQIGGGIEELQNPISESQDLAFYNAGINPIRFLDRYGYTITGARTSRIDAVNDYWYIEHSRIADFIISTVVNQILPSQINKENNESKRAEVRGQVDLILQPLTVTPTQWIREYRIKCDSENNTDEVLARGEFLLEIVVKFTPRSRTIKFIFTNVGQTVNIEEV